MAEHITVWSDWDAGWWARGDGSGESLASVDDALSRALGRPLSDEEQELARELARLYESEINAWVALASDRWLAEIGDEWTGAREATACALPLRVLLDWIPSAACRAFPKSAYADRFTVR